MKKRIYIIGGNGLIGSSFINSYKNSKNILINLDLKHSKLNKKKNLKNIDFDCEELENVEKKLIEIFKSHGEPDILINTSYPITKNWKENTFEKVDYTNFKDNINIHLNSYCWIAKIFADRMKKKKN